MFKIFFVIFLWIGIIDNLFFFFIINNLFLVNCCFKLVKDINLGNFFINFIEIVCYWGVLGVDFGL